MSFCLRKIHGREADLPTAFQTFRIPKRTAVLLILLMLLPLCLLTACGIGETKIKTGTGSGAGSINGTGADAQPTLQKFTAVLPDAFDTTISVTAMCESQERFDELTAVASGIFEKYHKLFDIYYTYPGINNLKTINDNAGKEPVAVESELLDFLQFAVEVCALTEGNVNIAMGGVLRLWHDAREFGSTYPDLAALPEENALREAGKHCSIENIQIDRAASTVYLSDPETNIDVGALAKGYTAGLAVKALKESGFTHVSLDAGGNICLIGDKGTRDWNVAVTNPDRYSAKAYLGYVSVSDCAVVTSGAYQRYFAVNGHKYHHIIDKDTLYPEERWQSVTVLYPDSALADAYSTALFNMDAEEGAAFVERTEGLEAMWVDWNYKVSFSPGFEAVYTSA